MIDLSRTFYMSERECLIKWTHLCMDVLVLKKVYQNGQRTVLFVIHVNEL